MGCIAVLQGFEGARGRARRFRAENTCHKVFWKNVCSQELTTPRYYAEYIADDRRLERPSDNDVARAWGREGLGALWLPKHVARMNESVHTLKTHRRWSWSPSEGKEVNS
jgi:hypothetical protein